MPAGCPATVKDVTHTREQGLATKLHQLSPLLIGQADSSKQVHAGQLHRPQLERMRGLLDSRWRKADHFIARDEVDPRRVYAQHGLLKRSGVRTPKRDVGAPLGFGGSLAAVPSVPAEA